MHYTNFIKVCVFLTAILPCFCHAQLVEDFSDGNISHNPEWKGNTESFKVNDDGQLQLDADGAGEAMLFTPVGASESMEWQIWVRQSFSPSGNNHSRVYLYSGQEFTSCTPDGIFLQLGEGGSDDAVRLYRQTGGDTTCLLKGASGAIASSFKLALKVTWSENQWKLFSDYSGGENHVLEASATDLFEPAEGYFGLVCKYTSSNATKFYFDDIYAGPEIVDSLKPQVNGISLLLPDLIRVSFSEIMDEESSETASHYRIGNPPLHPASVYTDDEDPLSVFLELADSLPFAEEVQIEIENISDLAGNTMIPWQGSISWYEAARYDIVINEIMADPSPAVLLPEQEYLELYNRTSLPVDLSGWFLYIGESEKSLEGAGIGPGGYLLIGHEDAEDDMKAFGDFYSLESFSLSNAGQNILLVDDRGVYISGIGYDESWYRDDDKSDGGWSLEQIDPENPCVGAANWKASKAAEGGSPGKLNTVDGEYLLAPSVRHICVLDSLRIRLEFNQSLGTEIIGMPEAFMIGQGMGAASAILPEDPWYTTFILYPPMPLQSGMVYSLDFHSEIANCMGDTAFLSLETGFGLSEFPAGGELVINEILFNPFPGGDDYVEVYNRSEKVISLWGLQLASIKNDLPSPPDTSMEGLYTECRVLLPGEYALFCKDFSAIDRFYDCPGDKGVQLLESFPAFNSESGTVALFGPEMELIDQFTYHDDMHFPLLNSVKGVSLERIHFDRASTDDGNWHSASQLSGFGTPGYRNSQFSEYTGHENKLDIEPGIFSPGYDGRDDHVNISIRDAEAGSMARIMIFNANGQLVRMLVNNELLGTQAVYSWDGTTDSRQKATAGIYVVMAEISGTTGKVKRYKESVVIAIN